MVFLCAASMLSLNSSLYKLDVWQLKAWAHSMPMWWRSGRLLLWSVQAAGTLQSPISGTLLLLLSIITVSLTEPFHHNSYSTHNAHVMRP